VQASAITAPSHPAAADLVEGLYGLLHGLLNDPDAGHFQVIEERDLSISQVRALLTLACSDPEPLPGGRIAERLGASPAAMSRALDGLVRKGLLERRESAEDRRVRLVAITDAGREIAAELTALRRAQIERFVGTLPPERIELLAAALAGADSGEGAG
jgi:DNA-binding MarR family transcriptional regulator